MRRAQERESLVLICGTGKQEAWQKSLIVISLTHQELHYFAIYMPKIEKDKRSGTLQIAKADFPPAAVHLSAILTPDLL